MPTIFICYRREDSAPYAGRLYDRLINHFGEERVFMDIDTIQPGEDFVEILESKVSACDVLIALIGRQWLTSQDVDACRRLDNPEDFVRLEILAAINRKIRIVPALVGGASMPRVHELPEALIALARRQAVEISDVRFHRDVNLLIESLEKKVEGRADRPSPLADDRLTMSYDLEVEGRTEQRRIPFVIGVLADLTGKPEEPLPPLRYRRFVEIIRENFNDVLKGARPRLCFKVRNTLSGEGQELPVELQFRHLMDFEPEAIVHQIEPLHKLLEQRRALANLQRYYNPRLGEILREILRSSERLHQVRKEVEDGEPARGGILLQIAKQADAKDDPERYLIMGLAEFFLHADIDTMSTSDNMASGLTDWIEALDTKISKQLDVILHAPQFQQLEATWRGLHYLVTHTEPSPQFKIRVLNVSKPDLRKDLEKAVEFDQSALFKKVYEEEYGTSGGEPFSLLIGDYDFDRHPAEISMLEKLSNVAAASHAPFVAGTSPKMFGIKELTELPAVRDLSARFKADTYSYWKSFRESEDSRYAGLVMPRILLRLPYGKDKGEEQEFRYHEAMVETEHSHFLWGNPAYAFGVGIINTFIRYGWCAAMQEPDGMLIQDLPMRQTLTDDGKTTVHCSTELAITEHRREELAGLGFVPLCYRAEGKAVEIVNVPSCRKPRRFQAEEQSLRAWLSTQLVSSLAVSRVTHYLKAIIRYKASRFRTREEFQGYLSDWVGEYVDVGESVGEQARPVLPFKKARIDVRHDRKPGAYVVQASLRPQIPMRDLPGAMKATTAARRWFSTDDIIVNVRFEE